MKVHSNFTGQKSKKRLIAFSCATALAGFALIARPAFAEEAKADNSSNLDVTAATTANVETTADLVETKVVEAPATTENVASTETPQMSQNKPQLLQQVLKLPVKQLQQLQAKVKHLQNQPQAKHVML